MFKLTTNVSPEMLNCVSVTVIATLVVYYCSISTGVATENVAQLYLYIMSNSRNTRTVF